MTPREYAALLKWNACSFFDDAKTMTASEALSASLDKYGHVEPTFIEELTGLHIHDVARQIPDSLFFNPISGEWEDAAEWLSGNVKEKYNISRTRIKEWNNFEREVAERAVRALSAVCPHHIPFRDIEVKFGTRWVPVDIYRRFICHFFGESDSMMDLVRIVYCPTTDDYVGRIELLGRYHDMSMQDISPQFLMMCALKGALPNGSEVKREFVRSRFRIIEKEWQGWLKEPYNESTRKDIENIYNDRFNCEVRPHIDGSFQTFPGLRLDLLGIPDLYPSQKDAVYLIKLNRGGGCIWHQVGTGKSLIMCVAAYECKRIGVSNKPLIIGMKANVGQIADTFRKAYPKAKMLFPKASDFKAANYSKLISRIKDEDWDCIIMSHDQFCRLPHAKSSELAQLQEDAEAMVEVIRQMDAIGVYGKEYKAYERKYDAVLQRIVELQRALKADNSVKWSDLGITNIFVDESHIFKALKFKTRDIRVGGIGNPVGSSKAQHLCNCIRDIQYRTGRDLGAVFLSGTIVSNSLTELYNIFNYLRPRALARQNIHSFDAWASTFAEKSTDFDLNMLGQTVAKEKFTAYVNVPELSKFLAQICDYRTSEMIGLDVPKARTHIEIMPATPNQATMMQRLIRFVDKAHEQKVIDWNIVGIKTTMPKNIDKSLMLTVTDLARKTAMDPRMLDNEQTFGDEPGNRVRRCAKNIYDMYVSSNDVLGTQFVFNDISTWDKDQSKWNMQSAIRDVLVNEYGLPSEEIVFINEVSDSKRMEVFAKMNRGEVRVLFGSTSKLGTGVNAQERAVAIHHLDVTWRTSDMEQRNGRALRKGNWVAQQRGNVVDIFMYATQGTMDAWKLGILRLKSTFIYQLNNGSCSVRRIDSSIEKTDETLSWAEFQNAVTGNQDLLTKTKLQAKVLSLESLRTKFYANRLELLTSTRLTDIERKKVEQSTWDGEQELEATKRELENIINKIKQNIKAA